MMTFGAILFLAAVMFSVDSRLKKIASTLEGIKKQLTIVGEKLK